MRQFSEVLADYDLKRFLSSRLGTLYFRPDAFSTGKQALMVRRTDGPLTPDLLPAYIDLWKQASAWIECRPELSALVHLLPPLEWGTDFVAREYRPYLASTRTYSDPEHRAVPPPELGGMRDAFKKAAASSTDGPERVIVRVLRRSIVEPNGKTCFDNREGKRFIILEPRCRIDDIQAWVSLKESLPITQ